MFKSFRRLHISVIAAARLVCGDGEVARRPAGRIDRMGPATANLSLRINVVENIGLRVATLRSLRMGVSKDVRASSL